MPEMDGLEILKEIRRTDQKTPVIAMSGGMRNAPVNFQEQAKQLGAQYVFRKPVGMDILREAIDSLLKNDNG